MGVVEAVVEAVVDAVVETAADVVEVLWLEVELTLLVDGVDRW